VTKDQIIQDLKGIHHPSTRPQVVANLYEFLSSAEHKGRYFEGGFAPVVWKSMVPNNCLVPIVLQNIFTCVQQMKETRTGLQQLEGE